MLLSQSIPLLIIFPGLVQSVTKTTNLAHVWLITRIFVGFFQLPRIFWDLALSNHNLFATCSLNIYIILTKICFELVHLIIKICLRFVLYTTKIFLTLVQVIIKFYFWLVQLMMKVWLKERESMSFCFFVFWMYLVIVFVLSLFIVKIAHAFAVCLNF